MIQIKEKRSNKIFGVFANRAAAHNYLQNQNRNNNDFQIIMSEFWLVNLIASKKDNIGPFYTFEEMNKYKRLHKPQYKRILKTYRAI